MVLNHGLMLCVNPASVTIQYYGFFKTDYGLACSVNIAPSIFSPYLFLAVKFHIGISSIFVFFF